MGYKVKLTIPFKEVVKIQDHKSKSLQVLCSNKSLYLFSSFAQNSRAIRFILNLWANSGFCRTTEIQERKQHLALLEDYQPATIVSEDDFEGVHEPEAKYEIFRATIPMTLTEFVKTFLEENAALRFEDLFERLNCQAVTRKSWKQLEEMKLRSRNLDYLAPAPVAWKQELVHVQTLQHYKLFTGILFIKSSTKYLDFDPLDNTTVEQNWILKDVAPGKTTLSVSLLYREKAPKSDSDLDLALRSQAKAFAELWLSEAKKRGLFPEKTGPEASHQVAKYEDVHLQSRLDLPQITAVYKNLAIYINSVALVALLAYLVYLHIQLEAKLSDPNCFR